MSVLSNKHSETPAQSEKYKHLGIEMESAQSRTETAHFEAGARRSGHSTNTCEPTPVELTYLRSRLRVARRSSRKVSSAMPVAATATATRMTTSDVLLSDDA